MPDLVYRIVVRASRLMFRALDLRLTVIGDEHVPVRGGAVLACNHTGYLDFVFAGLAAQRSGRLVRFMAKSGVFDPPVVGTAMRAMRHVPVDRDQGAGAYRQAGRELARGELVGVFPEATISRSWLVKPLAPGAAALAREHGVPLVPVVVWGGHRILSVDLRHTLRRGLAVRVAVGEPLRPGPDDDVARVSTALREQMSGLLAEARATHPDRPRDDADRWWVPAEDGGSAPTPEVAARLDAEALARFAARARDRRARRSRPRHSVR